MAQRHVRVWSKAAQSLGDSHFLASVNQGKFSRIEGNPSFSSPLFITAFCPAERALGIENALAALLLLQEHSTPSLFLSLLTPSPSPLRLLSPFFFSPANSLSITHFSLSFVPSCFLLAQVPGTQVQSVLSHLG